MQQLKFTIQGPPVAWHRPAQTSRTNRSDGRGVRIYKHSDDARYQKVVLTRAIAELARWRAGSQDAWDPGGEWCIDAVCYVPDLRRRDKDNLEKNILDGLTGSVYNDDTQVVDGRVQKRLDRANPRTVITVSRVQGYLDEP